MATTTHSTLASGSVSGATSPTLLARISHQDPQAWQELVALYGPLIQHWIRQQGISRHDASDVVQDVFAAVARSIDRFERARTGAFRKWLWTITRSQIVNWFRTRAAATPAAGGTAAWMALANVADQLGDDPDEFTQDQALTDLHRRGLELVRAEFEDRTWQMFWQVAVLDRNTSDVADEYGVTRNSVRQCKSRVLRRLRQVLNE